jgi:hypothetical protein
MKLLHHVSDNGPELFNLPALRHLLLEPVVDLSQLHQLFSLLRDGAALLLFNIHLSPCSR